MKEKIRRALADSGWSLNRLPRGIVMGFDLERDLPLALGSNPRPLCIDVGAHEGSFTRMLMRTFEKPVIHAFEPTPEIFERLRTRVGSCKDVHCLNFGLGSSPGAMNFNIYENPTLNSALRIDGQGTETLAGAKLMKTISVPVETLDRYAESSRMDVIDLLKIDVQGFELQILEGAKRLTSSGSIRAILLEINFVSLYSNQVWAPQIMAYLHQNGFGLVDFYEKCRLNPFLGWCTALFKARGIEDSQ